jgi:hypothetical protein
MAMIETLVAIAIAITTQTGSKAEALVQTARAAITSVRMVRRPTVRLARKHVGCGAVELAKAEADAEFARKVLVWPDSNDQKLLARQMLATVEAQKRAVFAVCAPSTVVRPRASLERRASPFEDDPFEEDRQDRRPADIDLDKTTVRVDGMVVPARQLVDTVRAMSEEIEELRGQLRELKEAKK